MAFAVALDFNGLIEIQHRVVHPDEHARRPAGRDADRLPFAPGGDDVVFARFPRRDREPIEVVAVAASGLMRAC